MGGSTWPTMVIIITIAAMVFIAYGIGRNQAGTVTETTTVVVDGQEIIMHQQGVIQRLQNQIDNFEPVIIRVPVPGVADPDTVEVKVYPVVKDSFVSEPYQFRYTGERLQFNTDIITTTLYELYMDEEGEFYRQFDQSLRFMDINYVVEHEVREVRIPAQFNLYGGVGAGVGEGFDMGVWIAGVVNERYFGQIKQTTKTTWANIGTRLIGW